MLQLKGKYYQTGKKQNITIWFSQEIHLNKNSEKIGGQEQWLSTKKYKIIQGWWCVPVTPATGEAEAGESLEHRRQRLQ